MKRNKLMVYLDDYEIEMDVVVSGRFDHIDNVLEDIKVEIRNDNGEIDITDIINENQMSDLKDMLFDELNEGWDE